MKMKQAKAMSSFADLSIPSDQDAPGRAHPMLESYQKIWASSSMMLREPLLWVGKQVRMTLQRPKLQWTKIETGPLTGYSLLIDVKSRAPWQKEMTHNIFDTFIYEALREKVRLDGRTVWDVGAHIGYHSLTFASLVGRAGHVVAFEPNPYNLVRFRQHLAKNQELEERITLVPCALSNRDGEETFIFSSELDNGRSSGSHLLHAFTPEDDKVYEDFTKMKVSVATIDRLLEQNYLPPPAVVKLDVEGAEGFVLEGATQLLRTIRPILLIEVHHIAAMHSVANILLPVGYSTKIIEDAPNSASRCFIMARPTR